MAGIEAQLNKINTEPGPGLEEKEEEIPLLELISADCLDSDARGGRTQALSEAEKDHLIATAKRDWGTRHMTLTVIQREAALCSFPFICAYPGLWAVYNMQHLQSVSCSYPSYSDSPCHIALYLLFYFHSTFSYISALI